MFRLSLTKTWFEIAFSPRRVDTKPLEIVPIERFQYLGFKFDQLLVAA